MYFFLTRTGGASIHTSRARRSDLLWAYFVLYYICCGSFSVEQDVNVKGCWGARRGGVDGIAVYYYVEADTCCLHAMPILRLTAVRYADFIEGAALKLATLTRNNRSPTEQNNLAFLSLERRAMKSIPSSREFSGYPDGCLYINGEEKEYVDFSCVVFDSLKPLYFRYVSLVCLCRWCRIET